MPRFEAYILNPYKLKYGPPPPSSDPKAPALDDFEAKTLDRFLRSASAEEGHRKAGSPHPKPYTFGDGTPMWADSRGRVKYQYAQAVLYKPSCLMACHPAGGEDNTAIDNHMMRYAEGGKFVETKAGDLSGVVVINLPMEPINKAIHRNRAILITAALVTAILAMVASYVIVRYVIVKPVKHLRDVSDAIAAGKLTIRARSRRATSSRSFPTPSTGCSTTSSPCSRNCARSTATSTARSTSWPRRTSPSSR